MILKRSRSTAASAILLGLVCLFTGLFAGPASAHPLTGGPATPQQVWVTVIGSVVTLIGVGMALLSSRDDERFAANRSLLRKGGLTIAAVGLLGFILGPDLVGPSGACDERPTTGADIAIISPSGGETFSTTRVPVQVDISGGIITDAATIDNVEGEGHIHISIDGKLTSMSGESEQVVEVDPGNHELEVEYVANDHAPFCTRVADRVRFSVEPSGSPSS